MLLFVSFLYRGLPHFQFLNGGFIWFFKVLVGEESFLQVILLISLFPVMVSILLRLFIQFAGGVVSFPFTL